MPFLAHELSEGLEKIGERKLAQTISNVDILDRCKCDSEGCGAFYTCEEYKWSGKELRKVTPNVKGLFSIDVLENEIVCIEFMGRTDVRDRLVAMYP